MNDSAAPGGQDFEIRKINSPWPYYIVAAFWLVCAFSVRMYLLPDFLILAAVSVVIFLICRKAFPPKTVRVKINKPPAMSGVKNVDKILLEGRGYIARLRELNDLIEDRKLSDDMDRLESIASSIFNYIAKHPEKASRIRRFVNYYFPSAIKMLETYHTMSTQGVSGENISDTMARIEKVMDTMTLAFEKQLDALFADEAIDISTDIQVLERMFEQEGLGAPKSGSE